MRGLILAIAALSTLANSSYAMGRPKDSHDNDKVMVEARPEAKCFTGEKGEPVYIVIRNQSEKSLQSVDIYFDVLFKNRSQQPVTVKRTETAMLKPGEKKTKCLFLDVTDLEAKYGKTISWSVRSKASFSPEKAAR